MHRLMRPDEDAQAFERTGGGERVTEKLPVTRC